MSTQGFAAEVQVRRYVAVLQGPFCRFTVFTTGSDKHYLFVPMDARGCAADWSVPVLKSTLRPEIRSALAHGWGNAHCGLQREPCS